MERLDRSLTAEESRDLIKANRVRFLSSKTEFNGHTQIIYRVLVPSNQDQKQVRCNLCTEPAKYWQWVKDHKSQIFIDGLCEEHAPDAWRELALKKELM